MTIQFELRFEDLLALQKHVIQHSYTHHIKRMYFKWFFAILLAVLILVLMNIKITTVIFSLFIVGLFFLVAPRLYDGLVLRKYQKQMKTKDYTSYLGFCKMELSETGILRRMNGKETCFQWGQFEKSGEDEEHYFLYASDLDALIIPKHAEFNTLIRPFIQKMVNNQYKGETI